jgi:ketosteroid isomerase-like protein
MPKLRTPDMPFLAQVEATISDLIEGFAKGDIKAAVAHYTDDVSVAMPGNVLLEGKAAVIDAFSNLAADNRKVRAIRNLRHNLDGRVAYVLQSVDYTDGSSALALVGCRMEPTGLWFVDTVAVL